jgi:hypothetical protein
MNLRPACVLGDPASKTKTATKEAGGLLHTIESKSADYGKRDGRGKLLIQERLSIAHKNYQTNG